MERIGGLVPEICIKAQKDVTSDILEQLKQKYDVSGWGGKILYLKLQNPFPLILADEVTVVKVTPEQLEKIKQANNEELLRIIQHIFHAHDYEDYLKGDDFVFFRYSEENDPAVLITSSDKVIQMIRGENEKSANLVDEICCFLSNSDFLYPSQRGRKTLREYADKLINDEIKKIVVNLKKLIPKLPKRPQQKN